jgi:broad specificity phosphatase PhoE
MIITEATCTASEFTDATGWEPKPEGMCQGDMCVPAPGSLTSDGRVDIERAAQALGMPIVVDEVHGIRALGTASLGGHALTTAVAADPELRSFDGGSFRLSSLRGRKVVLAAWASY